MFWPQPFVGLRALIAVGRYPAPTVFLQAIQIAAVQTEMTCSQLGLARMRKFLAISTTEKLLKPSKPSAGSHPTELYNFLS
jgi:hypothetical protein